MKEHNHDLREGDELTDTVEGNTHEVVEVLDNGSVVIEDDRGSETFTESEICASLRDSYLVRDGKGPELVNSY